MSDIHSEVRRTHGKLFAKRADELGIKLVAPDGGWGWIVVIACGLSRLFTAPIGNLFGLIFKDKFKDIGLSATDITTIFSINSAVGLCFGLINGPLLRRFSYRQMSICGSILAFLGALMMAFANSMSFFILSFGIIFALGLALLSQPQSYAINSYFLRHRSRAVSVCIGLSGLGSVLLSLAVGQLLLIYEPRDTMLILAALILHSLPASLLLQPVRWHMVLPQPEPQPLKALNTKEKSRLQNQLRDSQQTICTEFWRPLNSSVDLECASLYGPDVPILMERRLSYWDSSKTQSECRQHIPLADTKCESFNIPYEMGCNSNSPQILNGVPLTVESNPIPQLTQRDHVTSIDSKCENTNKQKTIWKRAKIIISSSANSIVTFFDLKLLCDPVYASLCIGISMAKFADINFSQLFSILLNDLLKYEIQDISLIMSIMSASDTIFRFAAPFIGEAMQLSYKNMCIICMILLIVARTLLLFVSNYVSMIVLGFGIGVAKGLRAVFIPLVIPSHVPLERLASAVGLQMVCNGILFLTIGPLLGYLRDKSGSYLLSVMMMNMMSFLTILLWTSQSFIAKFRNNSRNKFTISK